VKPYYAEEAADVSQGNVTPDITIVVDYPE
jgi:hypothetical protein